MKTTSVLLIVGMTGCVAGGGGITYAVNDKISPGNTVNIDCTVYEYGNSNVYETIKPVTVKYKINDGHSVDISSKLDVKSDPDHSYFKVDIFTNARDFKVGDVIYTEFTYKWHGKDETRTGLTHVVKNKEPSN